MKYSAFILKCIALVILCGNGALAQAGSETNFVSRINPPALVRSVFVDDPRTGKDPFFPNSVRRREVLETKASTTNAAPTPNALFSQLALKGVSGLKDQRLALINSSTVAEGEHAEIRAGYQIIKIICREIRDRSVLIEFPGTGEVRELKLREGI